MGFFTKLPDIYSISRLQGVDAALLHKEKTPITLNLKRIDILQLSLFLSNH